MNQEPTLDESLAEVMHTLPPAVRDYLSQQKYTPVTRSLMMKYNLRLDQGGILEREIMLLLMGIENPAEFTDALTNEARLDQQSISGIMQDVNTQIFIPLREQMRGQSSVTVQPSRSTVTSAPARVSAPAPSYAPPVPRPPIPTPVPPLPRPTPPPAPKAAPVPPSTPLTNFHLENKIAPLPPKMVMPGAVKINQPRLDSVKLLEDHEEPHLEFKKTAPAPENLPGVVQPPAAPTSPEVRPLSIPKVEPPQARPVAPPPVPKPPYVADPYREPIDAQ